MEKKANVWLFAFFKRNKAIDFHIFYMTTRGWQIPMVGFSDTLKSSPFTRLKLNICIEPFFLVYFFADIKIGKNFIYSKLQTLWVLIMDGVPGRSRSWLITKGWKTESTLELLSSFESGIPELRIHYPIH